MLLSGPTLDVVRMDRICLAVDLENVSTAARREGRLRSFLDELVVTVRSVGEGALLLGGIGVCDRHLQRESAFRLADLNVRVHARPNDDADSADFVIRGYLEHELPGSTDTVILVSGDHIFADVVERITAGGRTVVLMAVPGSVSADLYRAASHYVPLDAAA